MCSLDCGAGAIPALTEKPEPPPQENLRPSVSCKRPVAAVGNDPYEVIFCIRVLKSTYGGPT